MFTINAQHQQYTLVNKKYPDHIFHFNAVHLVKNLNRSTITANPVFRSKLSVEQFKKDITHNKEKINEWHIFMDENSNNTICQAKTLSSDTYTNDICIQEIDFNNEHLTTKLLINNIAVIYVYINMFLYKHMKKQQLIYGHLWLQNGYYNNNDGFSINFVKLIYNRNNN